MRARARAFVCVPRSGRKRGSTSVFFSQVGDEVQEKMEENEYGEVDHESVKQRLEFRERHQTPAGYDFKGAPLLI